MKVSLNSLKEYLDLPQKPEDISHALTMAGLEEEGIEHLGSDTLFEIGLTPNLGHCMSILGIARELSAILELPLRKKSFTLTESNEKIEDAIGVQIENPLHCFQYCARLVTNVHNGPSPTWIREKLERVGQRSINHIVDVGNLVMLEFGQPLHMFDYEKIEGKEITIRSAKNEKKMTTLDEVERPIPDGSLLICDATGPIAFAGVIGDFKSSVTNQTRSVLIEAAQFTPHTVRKTSKQLNLRTDSSSRFEKGIDPLGIERALNMAAVLLEGDVSLGIVKEIPHPYTPTFVELRPKRVNQILGLNLSIGEIIDLLARLEIEIVTESNQRLRFQIPSYRNDLHAEIDLIEEVGRMYGFNNIPRTKGRHISSTTTHSPLYLLEEESREKLISQGLQECLTCDLISPKLAQLTAEKALDQSAQIKVLEPSSIEQSLLRPSLLPGLLEMVRYNLDHQNQTLAAFEVGHIHFKEKEAYLGESAAGIILTGDAKPYHWDEKPKATDFFILKGHVENFFSAMGLPQISFSPSHLQNFQPGRQARVIFLGNNIAVLGQVHPKELREMGIHQPVLYAEIHLQNLLDLKNRGRKAQVFTRMPGSTRDWTLTLSEKIPVGEIIETALQLDIPLLENISLLDLYTSKKIGKEKKNATFRCTYRDPNKTVSYTEVEKQHKKITEHLAKKFANRLL